MSSSISQLGQDCCSHWMHIDVQSSPAFLDPHFLPRSCSYMIPSWRDGLEQLGCWSKLLVREYHFEVSISILYRVCLDASPLLNCAVCLQFMLGSSSLRKSLRLERCWLWKLEHTLSPLKDELGNWGILCDLKATLPTSLWNPIVAIIFHAQQ